MNLEFSAMLPYAQFFITGTLYTILIAFITVLCGSILGIGLSLAKLSKYKVLRFISSLYIECFRGTPILVQLYLIYFASPTITGIKLTPLIAGLITLGLNSGAYVSEIIRAGILAVDKGQMEAARSLGMGEAKAMALIIIPQAIKNILPALGNEFIVIIKESSIASVIGVTELMNKTDTIRGNTFRAFEPLIITACIYLVLTFSLSKFVAYFERRLAKSDSCK